MSKIIVDFQKYDSVDTIAPKNILPFSHTWSKMCLSNNKLQFLMIF